MAKLNELPALKTQVLSLLPEGWYVHPRTTVHEDEEGDSAWVMVRRPSALPGIWETGLMLEVKNASQFVSPPVKEPETGIMGHHIGAILKGRAAPLDTLSLAQYLVHRGVTKDIDATARALIRGASGRLAAYAQRSTISRMMYGREVFPWVWSFPEIEADSDPSK